MKKLYILFLALIVLIATSLAAAAENKQPDLSALNITPSDKVLGNTGAPVALLEYASLSCPHCAAFANEVLPKIEEKYINTGKVKYIYRHFPLNAPALKAAMLAECADKDLYYTFIKVLFESQKSWAYTKDYEEGLKNIAKLGGMTEEKFGACMKDKKIEEKIAEQRLTAEKKLDVKSTPTLFINGKMVEGDRDFDSLAKLFDAAAPKK